MYINDGWQNENIYMEKKEHDFYLLQLKRSNDCSSSPDISFTCMHYFLRKKWSLQIKLKRFVD